MKSQLSDHILLKNVFSVTSISSLIEGYLLNCRCEQKSTATIISYRYRLACFNWFCQANDYPNEPQKLTTTHIRQFLATHIHDGDGVVAVSSKDSLKAEVELANKRLGKIEGHPIIIRGKTSIKGYHYLKNLDLSVQD